MVERMMAALQGNKWNAIVAMSENRVIGRSNRLPWRIPSDMAWFNEITDGQILVMGRKTLESMKTLRPRNSYLVLTRDKGYAPPAPNVEVIHDLADIPAGGETSGRGVWICGGSAIYRKTLPKCRYLYITTVKMTCEGDAFFPPFEDLFGLEETISEDSQIIIQRYKNKTCIG